MLCQVYRSSRQEGMYLYVEKSAGLAHVPEPLLARFGEPEVVMMLLLDKDRKLARVDATRVRESIREQGFFLQIPPSAVELAMERADRE